MKPPVVRVYTSSTNRGQVLHQVCFYQGGQRQRRTFSHEPDARRFARQMETELASGAFAAKSLSFKEAQSYIAAGQALAELPEPAPLYDAVRAYVEAAKTVGSGSVLEACRFYAEYRKSVHDVRLDQAVDEFIQGRERMQVTEFHLRQLRGYLPRFVAAFPGAMLSELKTPACDRWLGGNSQWNPTTKNLARRHLVTLGKWCQKQGYLPKDRPTEFAGMMAFQEMPADVEIFTSQEIKALLDHAPEHLIPWLVIGAFCGLRDAEQRRLDWSDVKLGRGHLVLPGRKTKTRKRRIVPIAANAQKWLAPFVRVEGAVFAYSDNQGAQKAAARLCRRLNFRWKMNGLRHSFCSYAYALNENKHQTAKHAGNTPDVLDEHYLEAATKDEALAYFAIEPTQATGAWAMYQPPSNVLTLESLPPVPETAIQS